MLAAEMAPRRRLDQYTHPDISPVKGFDVTVTIKPLEDRILVQPLEAGRPRPLAWSFPTPRRRSRRRARYSQPVLAASTTTASGFPSMFQRVTS